MQFRPNSTPITFNSRWRETLCCSARLVAMIVPQLSVQSSACNLVVCLLDCDPSQECTSSELLLPIGGLEVNRFEHSRKRIESVDRLYVRFSKYELWNGLFRFTIPLCDNATMKIRNSIFQHRIEPWNSFNAIQNESVRNSLLLMWAEMLLSNIWNKRSTDCRFTWKYI